MKKIQILSLMTLMLLMGNTAMAQEETKSEISVSIGDPTPNVKGIGEGIAEAIGDGIGKLIGAIITMGQVDLNDKSKKEENNSIAYSLQYLYRVAPNVKVGGIFSYQNTSAKLLLGDTNGNYQAVAKASNNYFTVMPTVKGMWSENKNTGFYSKVAAGICIANNSAKMCEGFKETTPGEVTDCIKSDKGTRFAYQISVIGFEAGYRNIRGFIELGYGFQGLAQIGTSFKF